MEAWLGPAAGTAAKRPGGHFRLRNSSRVRQHLLLREQFGDELEPRLAPWMPSFIIHSNPIWLGTLLWVSHCSSSTLGSLRPRGGKKNLSPGCGRQTFWVGDVESFLALEMVLNSYTSSGLCFVSPKTLPYQKPPLGPGLCEKSLGLKELKSPLCIYTLPSTLVSGYSKPSILTTLHTDTHFSIPMPSF